MQRRNAFTLYTPRAVTSLRTGMSLKVIEKIGVIFLPRRPEGM